MLKVGLASLLGHDIPTWYAMMDSRHCYEHSMKPVKNSDVDICSTLESNQSHDKLKLL